MRTFDGIQKELEQVGLHSHSGRISVALYPMALYTVSSVLQIQDRGVYVKPPTYQETYKDCWYGRGIYHSRYFRAMRPLTPYIFERWRGSWFLFNRDYVGFNPNAGLLDEHPAIEHLRRLEWNRTGENKLSFFTDGIAPWCGREHLLTMLELFNQCFILDEQYRAGAEVSQ